MTYLLDVNALVALIDPNHVAHETAHEWFESTGSSSWATCPLTENGVIRIVGNPRYANSPGTPATIAAIVKEMRGLSGHQFWADDISLLASEFVDTTRLLASAQITDTYLLALARHRGGYLATFDRRLTTAAVQDGRSALHVIGA